MLSNILIDGNEINLENGEKNRIFRNESINLILGGNGSGKTRLLYRLINSFIDGRSYNDNFFFHKSSKNNFKLIYYTGYNELRDYDVKKTPSVSYLFNGKIKFDYYTEYAIDFLQRFIFNETKIVISFKYDRDSFSKRIYNHIISNVEKYENDLIFASRKYKNFLYNINLLKNKKNIDSKLVKNITKEMEYSFFEILSNVPEEDFVIFEKLISKEYTHSDALIEFFVNHFLFNKLDSVRPEILNKKYRIYKESKNLFPKLRNNGDSVHIEYRDYLRIRDKLVDSVFQDNLSSFSSGASSLINQFSKIYKAIHQEKNYKNFLILIDECDAFLHIEWQRRYVELVDIFLYEMRKNNLNNRIESIQLIIATHSIIIATDFFSEMICSLGDSKLGHFKTFASSLDNLSRKTFNTYPMGRNAKNIIDIILRKNHLDDFDKIVIESIGDDFLREAIREKFFRSAV